MMMAYHNPFANTLPRVLISTGQAAVPRWGDELADFLEPRGIGVERAYSGTEAISVVESGSINIVLLSTQLPRMDGLSVLRIIRSLDAKLPCVLVAPKVSKRLLEQALDLDAHSVFTTPVDTDLMKTVVTRIFRKVYHSDLGP